MQTLSIIGKVLLVVIFVGSVFHWVRCGFWVPRYIHYIAAGGLVVGILLILMSLNQFDNKRYIVYFIPLFFAMLVYVSYGICGGGYVTKCIEINDLFIMDRTMNREEVASILMDKMEPYKTLSYENLLILSINKNDEDIKTSKGNEYRFSVLVRKHEDDIGQEYLEIVGVLTLKGRLFYRPKAHVAFYMARNNCIVKDGLRCRTAG